MGKLGLLVMSYGTPAGPNDVEAYYTHIRRGHRPSAEQLMDLRQRYEAIGGVSPLAEHTRAQAKAIATSLEPQRWRIALAHKHADPFIEDGVAELCQQGRVDRIVGLVLAPHFSKASVGEYHRRAAAVAEQLQVRYVGIETWSDEPAWMVAQAGRISDALLELPAPTEVVFSAHSLPERVLSGDPYPTQLQDSAEAIAHLTGLEDHQWMLAWQSAGRTPEPWAEPDINEVIRKLGADGATSSVLVCPQGFASDHLEVLYDLDISAAQVAEEAGLAFARTSSINDDPAVMAALADRVAKEAA